MIAIDKQYQAMKKLGLTDQEIEDIKKCDEKIEKGEKLFELTKEQEQASKKARQTARKVDEKPRVREKKIDNDKKYLLSIFIGSIKNTNAELLEIVNDEREFTIKFNDKKYKIVLSAPRK